jgi:DNA polymerase (family X)
MINLRLANIFMDIAEIKKSGNTDKELLLNLVVAARTLRDNPESIKKAYPGGQVRELPGMEGPAYELLAEYMETGKIELYDRLKSKYDEDLITLTRISGLGKKRMFKIYEALDIKTIEELKERLALEDAGSRIYNIMAGAGFNDGADTMFYARRLKFSLDYIDSIEGLYPRWQAELFLGEIEKSLCSIKDIEKVYAVGSLRRKKPQVRDIDILVLPRFNEKSFDSSRSLKLLEEIKSLEFVKGFKENDIRPGSISARFETIYEVEAEIIISSHNNLSSDILYTTGSREHIKKLEEIARKRGLIENGRIKNTGSSEANGMEAKNCSPGNGPHPEEQIYRRLGLKYIPPELRENQGEIELAEKGSLPALLEMEDIMGDLHVHSRWSDGIISIDDMVERIRKYNYEYLAITDHSISNYYGRGLDNKRIQDKTNYINELKSRFKDFNILMGSEIDIKGGGKLDYPDSIIKEMEIAIGSMHSSFLNSKAENTARAISAVKNKYIDFIGHPTGVVFGNRAPYFIDIERLIKAAAVHDKALEINSYYLRMDLNEQNIRRASEMGVKLVINTDSHRPNNMDMMRLGVDMARRAGLEKKDVLNTFSLEELRKWKKKRKSTATD